MEVGMAWNEVMHDMHIQRCPIQLDLQELFLAWGNICDGWYQICIHGDCDTITVAWWVMQ